MENYPMASTSIEIIKEKVRESFQRNYHTSYMAEICKIEQNVLTFN